MQSPLLLEYHNKRLSTDADSTLRALDVEIHLSLKALGDYDLLTFGALIKLWQIACGMASRHPYGRTVLNHNRAARK